jgi:hypothetical protein
LSITRIIPIFVQAFTREGQPPSLSSGEKMSTAAEQTKNSRPVISAQQSHVEEDISDLSVLASEISDSVERYCRNRPRVVAGLIFSLGFVVGWKTRPW